MRYILFFIFGFALGSIPFGYIFARLKGIDIRTVGSGNIGGTNVVRACGKTIGIIVYILDILKEIIEKQYQCQGQVTKLEHILGFFTL